MTWIRDNSVFKHLPQVTFFVHTTPSIVRATGIIGTWTSMQSDSENIPVHSPNARRNGSLFNYRGYNELPNMWVRHGLIVDQSPKSLLQGIDDDVWFIAISVFLSCSNGIRFADKTSVEAEEQEWWFPPRTSDAQQERGYVRRGSHLFGASFIFAGGNTENWQMIFF